jgi:cellulose biosynthesis protein BcsQ
MDAGKNKDTAEPLKNDDLARDVARLYSLASVEDVPYYSFSRQRRSRTNNIPLSEVNESETGVLSATTAPAELPIEKPLQHPAAIELPEICAKNSAKQQTARLPEIPLHVTSPGTPQTSAAFAVYSLAGGVGKTTVTANLGRLLCSLGEKVLLVDATGSGLLPFYFGASDLRFGLRTFVAPDTGYPPMHVIGTEEITPEWLDHDLRGAMGTVQRTIVDLGPAAAAYLPQFLQLCAVVVVPLLSDLNSILNLSRIEYSIKSMREKGIAVPLPYYLFNKFDENSPMDQQAQELVARQCGDRLLPFQIRRSPDVTAAICDRMTVADHAPESEVMHDFLHLAVWLKKMAPVHQALSRSSARWSER